MYAPPVQRLITELSRLPGVGGRTAQRLAFHLLRVDEDEALALAEAIREVKQRIGLCEVCFNLADEPRCRICTDERRDPELICVVEEPSDVISIERTHEFRGRYHVLGGALSPIDGIDPEDLKIDELYGRVLDGSVREVVIATNPTTTGEATALHIAEGMRGRVPEVTVTRLASGLPVGADLEYADELTLGRAMVRSPRRLSKRGPRPGLVRPPASASVIVAHAQAGGLPRRCEAHVREQPAAEVMHEPGHVEDHALQATGGGGDLRGIDRCRECGKHGATPVSVGVGPIPRRKGPLYGCCRESVVSPRSTDRAVRANAGQRDDENVHR